jgi:6,7-dimethyl-8-ribityllumazine synthase
MSSISIEDDENPHVMIVEARFYEDIADLLVEGAVAELEKQGATCERFSVPGSLEIPAAIQYAVRGLDFFTARRRFDAYVALGCVIRGETAHYDIVCRESARGLMDLTLKHTLSVGNGILTCENRDQALERARPEGRNWGGKAAGAALRMLEIKSRFRIYPRK